MKERMGFGAERRFELQCACKRLYDALAAGELSLADPRDVDALRWKRTARRQVDACDLEEVDAFVAELDVATCRFDQTGQKSRPQDGKLDGDRLGQSQRVRVRVLRDERGRVHLGKPEPGEDLVD